MVQRLHGDKGYRGHHYPDRFKVWISGEVRRVKKATHREMRRRAAVEPRHRARQGRSPDATNPKGREGDRFNAVLAAAGYNFSLLLRWFEDRLRPLLLILRCTLPEPRFV